MGESMVEAPNLENKKRELISSGASLEVSVSFGRFENDSLSWEKWSTFSPNKYLEEVGKCSTPGSVAQKKAYFEAHYKRIAAQKAEEMEQEKQMVNDTPAYCDHNDEVVLAESTSEDNNKIDTCNENSTERDELVPDHSEDSNEIAAVISESRSSPVERSVEETDYSIHSQLEEEKLEEPSSVQDDTQTGESQPENVELPPVLVHQDNLINESHGEKVETIPVLIQGDSDLNESEKLEVPVNFDKDTSQSLNNKKEKADLDASSKVQKVKASTKERNLGAAKKKPASPLPRTSPTISTPKTSRSALISTSVSSSRSSTKKTNDSSSLRSKTNSTGVRKKVAPSALHMSLNFEPANSEATPLPTTRKSLIMESMGDKDIVKRAFKQFQNNFNQTRDLSDERSSGQKVSTTKAGQNLSSSLTPRKENNGVKKTVEKMDAQRAQLGRSWNTTSVRSLRGPAMDKKSAKPAPSSSGLRSDQRAEKRKEAVKKLEEKPLAKGAEKARVSSKSKEEKETDSRKLSRSLNSKASPLPGFGHGPVVKKSPLDKGIVKSERPHRPEMHR